MDRIKIYTDGGARGNPGPAAAAFVVKDKRDRTLYQKAAYLGRTTNNVAEYKALLLALDWLKKNQKGIERVDFYLDSQLVVAQMERRFKIKAANLKSLWQQAQNLCRKIRPPIFFHHLPRQKNWQADALLNQVLDLLESKKNERPLSARR